METETARELFRSYLYRRYGDRSTPKHYLSDLTIFLVYLGEKPVSAVNAKDIDGFVEQQHAQKLAPATINRRLATLRTFFECLAAEEPDKPWPNPVNWRRHGVRVGKSLPPDALGELVDLRLGDLDLAGGRIFIPSAKNGQERVVYLTPALVTALRNFLSIRPVTNDDHLWQYDGRRLTDERARNCVARWGEKCGIRVTPHRLRQCAASRRDMFATRLINQGVSLEVVRKLLGHSSLQMSQHYARLHDSTVRDQFESAAGELEGVVVRNWPMPAATPIPVQANFQQVDSV
jgi:site-specific recombinase XerD